MAVPPAVWAAEVMAMVTVMVLPEEAVKEPEVLAVPVVSAVQAV